MGRYYLVGIILFTLAIRLFIALQTQTFSYDGYAVIRQAEHISTTFPPSYYDALSYGGRQLVFSPFLPSVLALFGAIFPLWWVAKILPNIFAVITSIFVYLILYRLTHHTAVALFSALAAGIFPLFMAATISTLSPHIIALPLLLACIYYYLRVREDAGRLPILLGLLVVFPLVHPSALFFIGGILFYWLLCVIYGFTHKNMEKEILLFDTLYTVWVIFLLYKKAFLLHGVGVIWQNIPSAILDTYFEPLSFLSYFAAIGILPIILGTYAVYKCASEKGEQEWYLIMGFVLFFFVLLSFKLVEPAVGLLYMGIFVFILSGRSFCFALEYLDKTKLAEHKRTSVALFVAFFLISLFAFPKEQNHPSQALLDAIAWVREHSQPEDTILSTVEHGHLIAAVAGRKNVWDSTFLLVPAIEQRANDIMQLFQTASEVTAVKILSKYGVNYIIFSPDARTQYHVNDLPYTKNENCFAKAYDKEGVTIYKILCSMKQQ